MNRMQILKKQLGMAVVCLGLLFCPLVSQAQEKVEFGACADIVARLCGVDRIMEM